MKKFIIGLALLFSTGRLMAAQGDTWNFRFSPFGVLIGMLAGEVDYKITDKLVAGPVFLNWSASLTDISVSASGFGAAANYYVNSAYTDGLYFGGQVNVFSISASSTSGSNTYKANASGTAFGLRGGYHWFWDSFNLNLGLTAGSSSVKEVEVKDNTGKVVATSQSPGSSTGIDFLMGFTF